MSRSPLGRALRAFGANPVALAGLVIFVLMLAAQVLGPMAYGVDPLDIAAPPLSPPDADTPFGTDYLGRDILAAVLVGGRRRCWWG